jgi:hypothetical protein
LGRTPIRWFPFKDELYAPSVPMLFVTEKKGNLQLDLCYWRGLFSREEAMALLKRFDDLLAQIVTSPEDPIWSYVV